MTIETHRQIIEHDESSFSEEDTKRVDVVDNNMEEDEPEDELGDDVYALIFAYPIYSPIVLYSFFVLALEVAMIVLVYLDLLRKSEKGNMFNVPIQYDLIVFIAQVFVLPVVPFLFEDFKESLCLVGAEYNPRVLKTFPNARRLSFIFTCFLRFMVGFSLVALSFIQIIQSATVTDMILNLEALAFIGEIDNHGFWLLRHNFITENFRDQCIRVQRGITFPKAPGYKRVYLKRFVTLLAVGALVSAFAVYARRSWYNVYMTETACTRIYVTFPEKTLKLNTSQIRGLDSSIRHLWTDYKEEEEITLSSYNGVYTVYLVDGTISSDHNAYSIYYDENTEVDESGGYPKDLAFGFFSYCDGRWNFYIGAFWYGIWLSESTPGSEDCGGWSLRSPPTTLNLLEQVGASGWSVWTGIVEDAEGLSFSCVACSDPVDCNFHGDCIEKTCFCNDGRFGRKCEAEVPSMVLTTAVIGEESWDYSNFDGNLILVGHDGTPVENDSRDIRKIYDRPVYIMNTNPNPMPDDTILCLYYIGSRWVFQYWKRSDFQGLQDPVNTFWDRLFVAPEFYSEPTSSFSPFGLNWYRTGDSHSQGDDFNAPGYSFPAKLSFKALGQGCVDDDSCGVYGNCTNGMCECRHCFGGQYCEFAPNEDYARDQFVTWFNFGNASVSEYDYYKRFWSRTNALYDCVPEYKKAQEKIRKFSRRLQPLRNGN